MSLKIRPETMVVGSLVDVLVSGQADSLLYAMMLKLRDSLPQR